MNADVSSPEPQQQQQQQQQQQRSSLNDCVSSSKRANLLSAMAESSVIQSSTSNAGSKGVLSDEERCGQFMSLWRPIMCRNQMYRSHDLSSSGSTAAYLSSLVQQQQQQQETSAGGAPAKQHGASVNNNNNNKIKSDSPASSKSIPVHCVVMSTSTPGYLATDSAWMSAAGGHDTCKSSAAGGGGDGGGRRRRRRRPIVGRQGQRRHGQLRHHPGVDALQPHRADRAAQVGLQRRQHLQRQRLAHHEELEAPQFAPDRRQRRRHGGHHPGRADHRRHLEDLHPKEQQQHPHRHEEQGPALAPGPQSAPDQQLALPPGREVAAESDARGATVDSVAGIPPPVRQLVPAGDEHAVARPGGRRRRPGRRGRSSRRRRRQGGRRQSDRPAPGRSASAGSHVARTRRVPAEGAHEDHLRPGAGASASAALVRREPASDPLPAATVRAGAERAGLAARPEAARRQQLGLLVQERAGGLQARRGAQPERRIGGRGRLERVPVVGAGPGGQRQLRRGGARRERAGRRRRRRRRGRPRRRRLLRRLGTIRLGAGLREPSAQVGARPAHRRTGRSRPDRRPAADQQAPRPGLGRRRRPGRRRGRRRLFRRLGLGRPGRRLRREPVHVQEQRSRAVRVGQVGRSGGGLVEPRSGGGGGGGGSDGRRRPLPARRLRPVPAGPGPRAERAQSSRTRLHDVAVPAGPRLVHGPAGRSRFRRPGSGPRSARPERRRRKQRRSQLRRRPAEAQSDVHRPGDGSAAPGALVLAQHASVALARPALHRRAQPTALPPKVPQIGAQERPVLVQEPPRQVQAPQTVPLIGWPSG